MKLRTSILNIFIALFLYASLTLTQSVFAQEVSLTQDEAQIILNQFKLVSTFSQGDIEQYMALWSSDAEFKSYGSVYRGKEEIRAYIGGWMQNKSSAIQNLTILTVKGEIATMSTKTPWWATPEAIAQELDIAYRHKKEGNRWTIQVEDVGVPHAIELLEPAFDKEFREVFYPVFRKSIETLDQAQIGNFTAKGVKVISPNGQQGEGLLRLMEELQRAPMFFQDDVYINREKEVIAVLKTNSGKVLLNFEKQPDGSLILREADFSFVGVESITDVRSNGKRPTTWGKIKKVLRE